MAKTVAKTSFNPVEVTTEHQWLFNNWRSLYIYYDKAKSPKISMNGTEGCTCQISLDIHTDYASSVHMLFSDISDFLTIRTTTSLLGIQGRQLWVGHSETRQVPTIIQTIPKMSNAKEMEKYLQNDTLILQVEFRVLKAFAFSSSPNDVYGVNFAEIVYENSGAFRKFWNSQTVTFFIGGKELFIDELIIADKSEAFKYIFMGPQRNETQENTFCLSDTKINTFEEFCDYLHKKTVTKSEKLDDKFVIVDKYKVDELRTLCRDYICKRVSAANVIPANIVYYLCVIHKLLCKVFKAQALHFMEVNGQTFSIPKNCKLFAKCLAFVANDSKK